MFYTLTKLGALLLYAATLASYFVALPLPAEVVHWMRIVVGVLFVAHALEVAAFRRQIALYKGPMLASVALTLLFGFLHWKPLADAQR
jgi:uncharacterized protein YhhL (DUF1145 family)